MGSSKQWIALLKALYRASHKKMSMPALRDCYISRHRQRLEYDKHVSNTICDTKLIAVLVSNSHNPFVSFDFCFT